MTKITYRAEISFTSMCGSVLSLKSKYTQIKRVWSSINLTFLLIAFLLVSRKKETEDSIIGEWDVVTHVYTVYQNDVKSFEDNYTYKAGEFVLIIATDGTGKFLEDGKEANTFTWQNVSENKYSITQKFDPYQTYSGELEIIITKNTLTWESTFVLGTSKFVNYMICKKL